MGGDKFERVHQIRSRQAIEEDLVVVVCVCVWGGGGGGGGGGGRWLHCNKGYECY